MFYGILHELNTVAFNEFVDKSLESATIADKCGHPQEVIVAHGDIFRIPHDVNDLIRGKGYGLRVEKANSEIKRVVLLWFHYPKLILEVDELVDGFLYTFGLLFS